MSLTVRAAPSDVTRATPPVAVRTVSAIVLDRVARGLRGARARTGMSEADVVAILERQGIPLSVAGLRQAESSGAIPLALAACLADIYGTTADVLAGRRRDRKRLSLDDSPYGVEARIA
jgi:hypothetical protein